MDIKLDKDSHDLVFTGQDLVLATGPLDVIQSVKIRLLTIAGEWFLDDTIGWITLGEKVNKARLEAKRKQLLDEIKATPGIDFLTVFLTQFDFSPASRTLGTVRWQAKLTTGEDVGDTVVL